MDAYVFQAALLCSACAKVVMGRKHGQNARDLEDSDCYPQGPYSDGGGEADCPQHCDHCQAFLENPLTSDGYKYVRKEWNACGCSVTDLWRDFYEIS